MKKSLLPVLIIAILIVGLVSVEVVKANSSRYISSAVCTTSGNLSTTSLRFITPGTGTTTLPCNLEYVAGIGGGVSAMDSAILAVQYTASTTAPTLRMRTEISTDGIDWYPHKGFILNSNATTTEISGTHAEYSWSVSTTTGDFAGSGTATRVHTSIPLTIPARWVRVKFYAPIGTTNGALWAQIIGTAERIDK